MPGFEGTHGNTVHEPMLLHNETQHVSLKMDMSQLKVCDHFPPESTFPIHFSFFVVWWPHFPVSLILLLCPPALSDPTGPQERSNKQWGGGLAKRTMATAFRQALSIYPG